MKRAFRSVADAAGLPDVTPHTLRHTAATWLMQAGVDMWVRRRLPRDERHYADPGLGHHHPDHLKAARDAIGRRSSGGSCGATRAINL